MAHTPQAPQGNAVSKNLTVAQKQWLDGDPLEKVIADDHALKNMHYRYDGVMQEAEFMQLGSSQMPDFYALWVARRAELGRGPPLKKEQTTAYELAIATGEILTSNKD
ncbi:hypothetical protein PSHT_09313 [Puccinia striiformis]|uniref:Uncharacterized protein n=1 Tax=Puccinia striiformis TaxID=27350 RepID=A0A2S4VHP7_9BASI|nr:hypothetical protein PSHT_09313 [Puccinia striiformis]